MRRRPLSPLVLLWLLAGCFPEALSELGKRCSEDRRCSLPLVCLEGRCAHGDAGATSADGGTDGGRDGGADAGSDGGVPDAGTLVNLFPNPGFEDGTPPSGWKGSFGTTLAAEGSGQHGGQQSLRASFGFGGGYIEPTSAPVSSAVAGQTYCLSLFFRGTGRLVVLRLVEGFGGGAQESTNVATVANGVWQELRVNRVAGSSASLSIQAGSGGTGPSEAIVDDGFLWVSPSGACNER